MVAPDSVVLSGQLTAAENSKPAAVRASANTLEALTAELAALGGEPLSAESARHVLTWSAHSASTQVERAHDPKSGCHEATGRLLASVSLEVTLRDFALLQHVEGVLVGHEDFSLARVSWYVDDDNPAWPVVRATAIEAAVRKARDYAAALGGSVTSIDHVADVGLLAGGDAPRLPRQTSGWAAGASGPRVGAEAPSLGPVPQELTAIVEARFHATHPPLT